MTLAEQLTNDMKEAMRAKDTVKLTVVRGLKAACTNELVTLGRMPQDVLSDEEILTVIRRESKRRKDSIQQFTDGGRADLAENEQAELKVIEAYLPQMMSIDEIRPIAEAKKAALGVTDKTGAGKLVGALMAELKGKADGADVKTVVDSLFG